MQALDDSRLTPRRSAVRTATVRRMHMCALDSLPVYCVQKHVQVLLGSSWRLHCPSEHAHGTWKQGAGTAPTALLTKHCLACIHIQTLVTMLCRSKAAPQATCGALPSACGSWHRASGHSRSWALVGGGALARRGRHPLHPDGRLMGFAKQGVPYRGGGTRQPPPGECTGRPLTFSAPPRVMLVHLPASNMCVLLYSSCLHCFGGIPLIPLVLVLGHSAGACRGRSMLCSLRPGPRSQLGSARPRCFGRPSSLPT